MTISDNSRDHRKFADGATRNSKKGVPGLFPKMAVALGAVHHAGGEYFEGDKAHSVADMSEKIIKE
jgi:hypothetical protein